MEINIFGYTCTVCTQVVQRNIQLRKISTGGVQKNVVKILTGTCTFKYFYVTHMWKANNYRLRLLYKTVHSGHFIFMVATNLKASYTEQKVCLAQECFWQSPTLCVAAPVCCSSCANQTPIYTQPAPVSPMMSLMGEVSSVSVQCPMWVKV